MKTRMSLPRMVLLLVTLLGSVMSAKSGSVLLREGLYAEEVEGDLDAAIEIYQQVIDSHDTPENLVAQALYRQGMCHMKRKNETEAQRAFNRLVSEHADQTALIEKVQPLLAQLSLADPAGLMPPETLMYLEIGSPGRQIETILTMLKGTPFENPLAALEAGTKAGLSNQEGPAQMLNALLNPGMMAEFKKIRGMGIGILSIGYKGEPEAIVVLFPGESDALRGLITAALGFAGKPAESVGGMNVVTLPEGAAAAYDDTVVIISSPGSRAMERLRWSAMQYKSKIDGPTLASSKTSFTKIKKSTRSDNAVTLWLNVNGTYNALLNTFPADEIPQQIRIADTYLDFKNVQDAIASLSIRPSSLALEANINLKDGHNCLAYNMIHTPNLSKAAMQTIPADAFALVSLGVGQPGTPQAEAIGQQIKNAWGLDIGEQLYTNIDQIALFVVPVKEGAQDNDGIPVQAKSLGLAITSEDPEQLRQLLLTVLRQGNMIAHESEPTNGNFSISLVNNIPLQGYLDQAGKTMILSINPDVIQMSSAALKQRASAIDSGPLTQTLKGLPGSTSKLALVNVAGMIRFAATGTHFSDKEQENRVLENFAKLAQLTENTMVRLATSEEDNNLSVQLNVSGLPPVGEIIGPVMQIAQIVKEETQPQDHWAAPSPPAIIAPTETPPTMDRKIDDCWAAAQSYPLKKSFYDPPASQADLSAGFKALWDKDYLYLLVEVTDDQRQGDSDEFWQDDGIEVFIDADNSKSSEYGSGDYQFYFSWKDDWATVGEARGNGTTGVKLSGTKTDTGYRVKIRFAWSTLGVKPAPGVSIGLDVQVNDDDDGGQRDSKIAWNAVTDDAWINPQAFGTAQLGGLIAWWKLDESTGDEAADASGNGRTAYLRGSPQWRPTSGKINGALELDGTDDYVETGNTMYLPVWTIATWVKSPAAPSSMEESGPIHREANYQINWDHLIDEFRGAAGVRVGMNWYGAGFGDLRADTWYHLTATYDGENLRAYRDGVLISDNAGPSGPADAENATLKLGRHALRDGHFAGTIDEVRIYNTVLGEAEIAALAGK